MKLRRRRVTRNEKRRPTGRYLFAFNETWIGADVHGDPIRRFGELGCMVEGDDGQMHSLTGAEMRRAMAYFDRITGVPAQVVQGGGVNLSAFLEASSKQ